MSDNRPITLWLILCVIIGILILGFAAIGPKRPTIIVNMPADAKPLSVLETHGQVVGPDRAVLWYSAFISACDRGSYPSIAANIADQAVQSVYGPAPTH